jgi:putative ABC transport system permease protein
VDGRAPTAPDEIAVGADTLDRVSAGIGDHVVVAGPDGQLKMRVVGTAVFPESDQVIELAHGVLIDAGAIQVLGTGTSDFLEHLGVKIASGADHDAVLSRLSELNPDGIEVPAPPPGVERLAQVDDLPTALAVVLAGMAVLGIAHALGVCVRRRARDLALLRALGLRARDIRVAVDWQSLAMVAAGVIVGVPLGVLIGRLAWAATADSLGVRAVHPVSSATGLVVPAAALVALAVAVVPAARAAHGLPSTRLRAE